MNKLFVSLIIIGAVILGICWMYLKSLDLKPVEVVVEKDTYGAKIEQLKDKVLNDLSLGCETKGVEDPDGAIVFDSNGEFSIGRYQFQRRTIKHFIKKFEARDISNREAIEIAIDPVQSKALAKRILFEEPNGVSNWKNCDKKMNLTVMIELLKDLQN